MSSIPSEPTPPSPADKRGEVVPLLPVPDTLGDGRYVLREVAWSYRGSSKTDTTLASGANFSVIKVLPEAAPTSLLDASRMQTLSAPSVSATSPHIVRHRVTILPTNS